jgi:hypothetical protein
MLFDANGLFSSAQVVTSSAASTNYYDFGAPGTPIRGQAALTRDLGKGQLIPVRVQIVTAMDALTSLKVAWQMDDDSAFGSATTVLETEAIALATLVSGYVFNITNVPLLSTERYGRFYYTVAGSANVAGSITAGIVTANQTNYS